MRKIQTRHYFLAILVLSIASLCGALYLQIVRHILPCPLCVLQRYMFAFLCIICILGLFFRYKKTLASLGIVSAIVGLGLSVYQLWVMAHPSIKCGRDPLEAWVNHLWPSRWCPILFHSDSYCSTKLPPFFFLTPPQWGVVWFTFFVIIFVYIICKKRP